MTFFDLVKEEVAAEARMELAVAADDHDGEAREQRYIDHLQDMMLREMGRIIEDCK